MSTVNSKNYRIGVVTLLTLCNFVNAMDRASLSVAVPYIIRDFHINTVEMGIALSAFFWTYVLFNVPAGNLADRFGAKKVLGWSVAIWSICSALTGIAHNVFQVVVARIGVGIGEAAILPCNAKITANTFSSKERGTVMSIALSGIRLGNAATPIMMAFLVQRYGWRQAFILTGIGSLLWCVLWYFGYRDSRQPVANAPREEKIKIPWKVIVTNRTLLGMTVVKFLQDYLMWMFMTWVPGYLIMGRGFSVVTMGFYMSVAYAASAISQPLVGIFSDWLIRRGLPLNRARKAVLVTLQLLASTIIITGFSGNVGVAMMFLVIAVAGESDCSAVTWTIISDVVPGKLVGSVGGAMNSIGAIGGILAPILTGIIVKTTGSFLVALVIGGCAMLTAAAFTLFVVPTLKLQESLEVQTAMAVSVTGNAQ